jgi:hypothetical protein
MYVLGRFGTYFVELAYNVENEEIELTQAIYAEEGFEKHHKMYIE